jgi:tetratricopeptide (TPR) repeat protein
MITDLMTLGSLSAQSYELQGWILIETGDFRRAKKCFQRAVQQARSVNDRIVENRAQIGLCHTMIMNAQYDAVEHRIQRAIHIARSISDRYGQVLGLRTQAFLHLNRHNINAARRAIWQAIAIANSSRIGVLEIVLLNQLEKLARAMQ